MIRPTAHRSRAWTRQNGGRARRRAAWRGAAGLLGGGAGWRARGGRRRGSWSPQWGRDYCLTWSFLWTPRPVELRTYVRYPSPHGTALGPGGERGGRHALPRRAGGRAPRRARAPTPGWSSSTSTPAPSSTRCRRRAWCPSGTRSTRIEAAATPACTASPGRPTTTSGSGSARTSSARSWSRSTPSSACAPSCARPRGPATTSPWAPTPTPTSTPRASTT